MFGCFSFCYYFTIQKHDKTNRKKLTFIVFPIFQLYIFCFSSGVTKELVHETQWFFVEKTLLSFSGFCICWCKVKTEHFVARTFFSVLLCLARASLSTFFNTHACVAQVGTCRWHLWCLEWFAPLRIKNTSSSFMYHPNLLATSDHMFYETGEGSTDWNQDPLKRNSAGGAVWLSGRLHPQGMSPRCASTLAVSTLRSFTPTEGTASTLRITSLSTVAASETSHGFQKLAAASGGSQFVQTGDVIFWLRVDPWSELTWLFDINAQFRDDCLELKRTWKQESGKRVVLIWLFMKPIENLSLKDWCCIKLINGLIRLREKGALYVENWKWETDYSMKVVQGLAKKLKNCEEFVAKTQIEPDNWRIDDNNEARVMASIAAKVSEDLSIKDAEILRLIEDGRSPPKEEKQRLKEVSKCTKNVSETKKEGKDNKASKEFLKTSKEYEISRESN